MPQAKGIQAAGLWDNEAKKVVASRDVVFDEQESVVLNSNLRIRGERDDGNMENEHAAAGPSETQVRRSEISQADFKSNTWFKIDKNTEEEDEESARNEEDFTKRWR
jgi:hypothetical protein